MEFTDLIPTMNGLRNVLDIALVFVIVGVAITVQSGAQLQ